MPPVDDDAVLLTRLASELHLLRDEEPTVAAVVRQATEVVPDAEHVSVTLRLRRGRWGTVQATSDLAQQADALQYALAEGPCVDSTETGGWHRAGDLREDVRWPSWSPRAAALGIRSLVSVHLSDQDGPFGAVNMYATRSGRFVDPDQVDRALLWATHVGTALTRAKEVGGLETALASRHTIGMAQGIVMERFGLDDESSFKLLSRLSSHTNVKLRELAGRIVRTRELPDTSPPRAERPRD